MKKGFTLIELLGVIILISMIMLLVLPIIINSVRTSATKTDEVTYNLIYNASEIYISRYPNDYEKVNGNKYIIKLSDLVHEDLLSSPLKISTSNDITNEKCVQVTYRNGYKYEIKDIGECEELIDSE